MNRKKLEKKYGKALIERIEKEGYLEGCTIAIINGQEDIPEEDILNALREMKGQRVVNWD